MKIILADFNLAVSTPTAKPPHLIPRQIFQLYDSAKILMEDIMCITAVCCLGSTDCVAAVCVWSYLYWEQETLLSE